MLDVDFGEVGFFDLPLGVLTQLLLGYQLGLQVDELIDLLLQPPAVELVDSLHFNIKRPHELFHLLERIVEPFDALFIGLNDRVIFLMAEEIAHIGLAQVLGHHQRVVDFSVRQMLQLGLESLTRAPNILVMPRLRLEVFVFIEDSFDSRVDLLMHPIKTELLLIGLLGKQGSGFC